MQFVTLEVPECMKPAESLRALLAGGTIHTSRFDLTRCNVKL